MNVHAGVECRRQAHSCTTFSKIFKTQISIVIIRKQHENFIQMSTNMPSIGPVVFETTVEYFEISNLFKLKGTSHDSIFQFSLFSTLADILAI